MIPKYRVWLPDPDVEKMLKVKALVFEDDKTRCVCGYAYDFYLEDEDATIMQSTGLKDKNGKEIFEGDILGIELSTSIVYVNVFWDDKHALFMLKSEESSYKEALAELVEDYGYPYMVVGNIRENPELLEVE
jgi:uncharacterized phage protein (TIGR01671 family)